MDGIEGTTGTHPPEGITARFCRVTVRHDGETGRSKSQSHTGISDSLIGWGLRSAVGGAVIEGFDGQAYAVTFMGQAGGRRAYMTLAELLRYRTEYEATFVRNSGGYSYEIINVYADD